ncbi:hypothetical protein DFH07DRAFT_809375 [Mycena maculata]|uniref:Uncharacterized protein n=1 Tax=Mycena maculata TaxID=230809 RepID=A0AAD7JK33_9AGAR|nr:hypothetical protein DFH07DRAFT_809375 [Mycena maculata]
MVDDRHGTIRCISTPTISYTRDRSCRRREASQRAAGVSQMRYLHLGAIRAPPGRASRAHFESRRPGTSKGRGRRVSCAVYSWTGWRGAGGALIAECAPCPPPRSPRHTRPRPYPGHPAIPPGVDDGCRTGVGCAVLSSHHSPYARSLVSTPPHATAQRMRRISISETMRARGTPVLSTRHTTSRRRRTAQRIGCRVLAPARGVEDGRQPRCTSTPTISEPCARPVPAYVVDGYRRMRCNSGLSLSHLGLRLFSPNSAVKNPSAHDHECSNPFRGVPARVA